MIGVRSDVINFNFTKKQTSSTLGTIVPVCVRITGESNQWEIEFEYQGIGCSPTLLKSLGGKLLGDKIKVWRFPYARSVVEMLARRGLILQDRENTHLGVGIYNLQHPEEDRCNLPSIDHRSDSVLYPYQKESVNFLRGSPYRKCMLNLSPGLGKSLVSIVAAEKMKFQRILIVCPKILMGNWEREIRKWSNNFAGLPGELSVAPSGNFVQIVHQTSPAKGVKYTIANYDTVIRRDGFLGKENAWDLIIGDESVLLKNRETQRFKKFIQLWSRWTWLLSGSPTTKFADDLYTQMRILNPRAYSSYWRFAGEYTQMINGAFGIQIVGTVPGFNPRVEFADLWFGKTLEETNLEIPPLITDEMSIQMLPRQRSVYKKAEEKFLLEQEENPELPIPSVLAQLIRLTQICSHPKNVGLQEPSAKEEALMQLLEASALAYPVIVWTHWVHGAESLHCELRKKGIESEIITGKTGSQDRECVLEKFHSGKVKVLVLSLGVGRFGLTLNEANTVVYLDRTWDADAYWQSLHRVRRIGQTKSVRVVILRCPDTIEEDIEEVLRKKLHTTSQVTGVGMSVLLTGVRKRVRGEGKNKIIL